MNKEDKYQLAIICLAIINIILILFICFNFIIIKDLDSTIDRHKNNTGVCRVEFKELKAEYEEYKKQINDVCNMQIR